MSKLIIPAILAATVLVAGIFAFMPVQQASTVHTTLGTAADIATVDANVDAILLDTGTTLNDLLDTEVADILADTAIIGALVGGAASLNADIDNTQNQIANLVTTGSAAVAVAAGALETGTAIAAATIPAGGVAYVTVEVTTASTLNVGGNDSIDIRVGGVVVGSIAAEVTGTTTVAIAAAANDVVDAIEVDGGADSNNAAWNIQAVVISSAVDPT